MLQPLTLLQSSIPCRSCHAGCCRSFVVPLTGHDLLRIRETTGRGLWDFACRWEDDGSTIPEEFAPRLSFPDAPDRLFVVGLKHARSELFPDSDCCEFLRESRVEPTAGAAATEASGCAAHCAIHQARPGVCRLFPLKLDISGGYQQRELPAHGRETSDPAYRLCPRDWTPDELRSAHPPALQDEVRGDLLVWREVASLWNETGLSAEHLSDFLDAIYSGLARDATDGTPETPAG
jgi:Fe-S-cluster containining protein